MHSERGFVSFLLAVAVGGAMLYLYMYGLPGKNPGEKSSFEMQMDALQKAKSVQTITDKHNQELEAAIDAN